MLTMAIWLDCEEAEKEEAEKKEAELGTKSATSKA